MPEVGAAQVAVYQERRRTERGLALPNPGAARYPRPPRPIMGGLGSLQAAPTVTFTEQGDPFPMDTPNQVYEINDPKAVRVIGTQLTPVAPWFGPTGTVNVWPLEFMADALAFAISTQAIATTPAQYRMLVDGEFYNSRSAQLMQTGAGGVAYMIVTFADRRWRHIRLELDNAAKIGTIFVAIDEKVVAPTTALHPLVIFPGDSLTEGAYTNTSDVYEPKPFQSWAMGLCDLFGFTNFRITGSGGTGILDPGVVPGRVKLGDRLQADVLDYDPGLVIPFIGYNDGDYPTQENPIAASEVEAEALSVYGRIKNHDSAPNLAVVGMYHPSGLVTQRAIDLNEAHRSAASGAGADVYVDVINTTTPGISTAGFMTGTGKETNIVGDGNADRYRCHDGSHMTPDGYAAFAQYIGSRIATALPF